MSEGEYQAEIGQAVFGQPHQRYDVPPAMETALDALRCAFEVMNPELPSPFGNNGPPAAYRNDVFEAIPYDWSEDEQPYNFAWRDLRVSWYKYCGRGMSANMRVTRKLAEECLRACLSSLLSPEPKP